jgi:cytochrome b561
VAGALKHHFIDRDGLLRRMRFTRGWSFFRRNFP